MNAHVFAFQPGQEQTTLRPTPEPARDGPLPEREWGLSAGQVAAVVVAIVAVCELIGLLA